MSFNSGQLIIIEDGTPVDRTAQIHDDSSFSWSNTRGRRGTASVPLVILADQVFLPVIGWPVYIYEVYQTSPMNTERVFAGVISEFDFEYFNDAGDRICTLTVVSLEKYFDTIQTPQADYTGMTAGQIFIAIYNACIGSLPAIPAITLGTVEDGVTISERTYNGTSNAAADFQQLATDSGLIWYVDPRDLKLYFHAHDSRPSAITVESQDVYVEAGKSSIKWSISDADFRDRQLIQTSPNVLPPLQATFTGNGTQTAFTLPNIASTVTGATITTGTSAVSTGTFTDQPNDGDTVTINGRVYTLVAVLNNHVSYEVLIGASFNDTAQNLADAINWNPLTNGFAYSLGSSPNPDVAATDATAGVFQIIARAIGPSTITAESSASNFSWSDSPLAGGTISGVVALSVGITGSGGFNLSYQPGSAAITLSTAPGAGITLTVSYMPAATGQLNSGSGAASTLGVASQFRIQAARSAPTSEAAAAQNAATLAAYSVLPKVFEFTSDTPGLYCGDYAQVALTVPTQAAAVLNGFWLVQEVQGNWIAGFELNAPPFACHFRYTYQLINTTEIATYQDTLSRLVDTGPFEQPSPVMPPDPTTDTSLGGDGTFTGGGQDWVQEHLRHHVAASGTDLVVDDFDDTVVTSASHTFTDDEVGEELSIGDTEGWTTGNYIILSVSTGAATLFASPAATGTTGGHWSLISAKSWESTWIPRISPWTGNPIAIVTKFVSDGGSPVTYTGHVLTPFRYNEQGYAIDSIDLVLGPDYSESDGIFTFKDDVADGDFVKVEYFPSGPTNPVPTGPSGEDLDAISTFGDFGLTFHSDSYTFADGDVGKNLNITGGGGWTPETDVIAAVIGGDACVTSSSNSVGLTGGIWNLIG